MGRVLRSHPAKISQENRGESLDSSSLWGIRTINIMKEEKKLCERAKWKEGSIGRGKSVLALELEMLHNSFFPAHIKGSNPNAQCNKRNIFYELSARRGICQSKSKSLSVHHKLWESQVTSKFRFFWAEFWPRLASSGISTVQKCPISQCWTIGISYVKLHPNSAAIFPYVPHSEGVEQRLVSVFGWSNNCVLVSWWTWAIRELYASQAPFSAPFCCRAQTGTDFAAFLFPHRILHFLY